MKTYFLDTNIFVRYVVGDTENSKIDIQELFQKGAERKAIYITKIETLIELNYVLKTHYNQERKEIILAIKTISGLGSVDIINMELKNLENILKLYNQYSQLSLEDCIYLEYCLDKKIELITLDKKLRNVFDNLSDLEKNPREE